MNEKLLFFSENFNQIILGLDNNNKNNDYITNITKNKNNIFISFYENISNINVKPFFYKFFFKILNIEKGLDFWIDTQNSLILSYNDLKKNFFSHKNKINSESNELINNNNLINIKKIEEIINLDIRSIGDLNKDLNTNFLDIKEIIFNILFIFFQKKENENSNFIYQQGMAEIIYILFYNIYQYYFDKDNNEEFNKNNLLNKYMNLSNKETLIYLFFHNKKNLECDLYYLFNNFMNNYLIYNFESKNLISRINYIINVKLKQLDYELYNYLYINKIEFSILLERYVKCLFYKDFENINDVILIIDNIIFYELINDKNNNDNINNNYKLIFIDYICLAIIIFFKKKILKSDETEIIEIFLKDLKININLNKLIILAKKIENNYNSIQKEKKNIITENNIWDLDEEENENEILFLKQKKINCNNCEKSINIIENIFIKYGDKIINTDDKKNFENSIFHIKSEMLKNNL